MGAIIGIDFGTTNSLCAWMDGDRPALIHNRRGGRITPSVVAAAAKGEILVGESAKNQALVNPENTVAGIKRHIGSGGLVSMGGRSWRPEELAAMILSSLRLDAESHLGTDIERAVITVPANFSDRQRRGIVEAGRLAGLEVLRVVNEPTAAAVARAWAASASPSGGERALVLVYDFGGGTFDVTLLVQEGTACEVLASRGDGRLGGADIDRELYRQASAAFREEYGLDVEADRFLAQQLAEASELAKMELSEREESAIGIPFALAGGKVVHPLWTLTRRRFEELAAPFVERSLELTERVLAEAGLSASRVDSLVLSGGSSRMPLVRALLAQRLGLKPQGGVNPEEIVALGAAVWSLVDAQPDRLRIRDVVSRSYGVEIDGGRFVPLIRKNSPVPASSRRVFTTVADDQDAVEIHVLQGESPEAAENVSLGRFLLSGLREAKRGEPRIEVSFGIDESDMLHVSAADLDTGALQEISIVDLESSSSAEGPAELGAAIRLLAGRLAELRSGLRLERGLESELDETCARAAAAGPGTEEPGLRLLKTELEALVGELLARRAERRAIAQADKERT
ncbi:MAG TPA: Hsp70 family protein [Rectinemataceae bacterium]|nr:Hsp70 family protein [Rectinemataceae bacterium]